MGKDLRAYTRKALRVRGTATLEGGAHFDFRTLDISRAGVCICLPRQINPELRVLLKWTMMVNGKLVAMGVVARVVYCVLGGCDDNNFRAGMNFLDINPTDLATITAYLE